MALNDILSRYQPTGASELTAKQDGLHAGLEASRKMAQTDLPRLQNYCADFIAVGLRHSLPPALLAAIASRESRGGKVLENGWGDHGHAFGLMQVDKRWHSPAGGPYSREHIDQAAGILKDCVKTVTQKHPTWLAEQLLRGGVAAYNFGASNVKTISGMDVGTTGGDYSNDVWARAQALAPNIGGMAGATPVPVQPVPQKQRPPVVSPSPKEVAGQPQGDPAVLEVQKMLIRHGYMTEKQVQTGPGILGPKTRAALSRFVSEKGKAVSSGGPIIVEGPPSQRPEKVVSGVSSISARGKKQMDALVDIARRNVTGTVGWCYKAVAKYLDLLRTQGTHYGSTHFNFRTDGPGHEVAAQFGEWLNIPGNLAKAGLCRLALTTPYDAPKGSIMVVGAGSPGTSHHEWWVEGTHKKKPHKSWAGHTNWPGDISVATGDGNFINDHLTQQYGSRSEWEKALKAGTAKLIGVYAPL